MVSLARYFIRYPFLSPLPHDSQAWESLLGSPVAGARRGLSPQMSDVLVGQKNEETPLGEIPRFL